MYQTKTVTKWVGALALVLASGAAFAQALPSGTWRGVVRTGDRVSAIDVIFKAEKSEVRFGAPFNCRIAATFVRRLADASIYNFGISIDGGQPCNNLSATGRMEITAPAEKKLHVGIAEKTRDGARNWQADLEPATP